MKRLQEISLHAGNDVKLYLDGELIVEGAKAELFAAAPEMLELLRDYREYYRTYSMQDMTDAELKGELDPDVFKAAKRRHRKSERKRMINTSKRCKCGAKPTSIPDHAVFHSSDDDLAGWYWNCPTCRSTLFVPARTRLIAVSILISLVAWAVGLGLLFNHFYRGP